MVINGYSRSKLQNMEALENMLKAVRESGDHYQVTIRMRSRLFNCTNGRQNHYNCTFRFLEKIPFNLELYVQ